MKGKRAIQLLETVPDNKIAYVIGYIQGLTMEKEDEPNEETIAAYKEGDESWFCDLKGDYIGKRECHILPDWLLIYRIEDKRLVLYRTGIHSDLFNWK